MVHHCDERGMSLHHDHPCSRSSKIAMKAAVFLATIANLSTVATAQITSAPTPKVDTSPGGISSPTFSPITATAPTPPKVDTLAPFTPVSSAPVTSPPATSAPITPIPTETPTLPPVPPSPTISPAALPSFIPSISSAPTFRPSIEPTISPTRTHRPSGRPSTSTAPSSTPTSPPSYSPVFAPSGSPSTNVTVSVKRECEQILVVQTAEEFIDVQVGIYQLLMESYTVNFGFGLGEPQIVTLCEVTDQDLAGRRRGLPGLFRWLIGQRRRLQTANIQYLLVLSFTMQYESRFGEDIEDYPSQFQNYINSNLEKVTQDMESRFLPVIEARSVIVYKPKEDEPTLSPTRMGPAPSMRPTISNGLPTSIPSTSPTSSLVPSAAPTYTAVITAPPNNDDIVEDRTSFIVGLAAGLGGAALVICFLIWYMRRKNKQKEEERRAANANNHMGATSGNQQQNTSKIEDQGIEVPIDGSGGGMITPGSAHAVSQHSQQYDNYPPQDGDGSSSPQGGVGTIADSIFSNPSMVSGGGSFSSNPEDYETEGGVRLDPLQDEFDHYKNQDLELLREGVEESLYGAEGMMSLAMTRALFEEEDNEVHPNWGGAEDAESIEANGLCETNDWLRKNEHSTLEERNQFFQEILNRMVITVRRGMISPSDGTRAIHCCAAMLGLQLEKELPNNVLLVHGMRKTSDLTLGRSYLEEAFKSFGDIEGAAIAPSNRGFGFVRFVSPKSVQRALERFRISEIEVQDVSVMIKSLKADTPAM